MTYAPRLSDDELARYRMMAQWAREQEADLWDRAGLTAGARVADVGCGPGAMVATLAAIVGPDGFVVGVDGDEHAVAVAAAVLEAEGIPNAAVRVGRADDTGLPEASFDVVVLRHVLAHNGGAEQRIVDHLARLAAPAGHVYLVDADPTEARTDPSHPQVEELQARYRTWHARRGNDLRVGRRLADLGRASGLDIEVSREWFAIGELAAGVRGPAWAARDALVRAGLASEHDVARWASALDEVDASPQRPTVTLPLFAAVCRRPRAATPRPPA